MLASRLLCMVSITFLNLVGVSQNQQESADTTFSLVQHHQLTENIPQYPDTKLIQVSPNQLFADEPINSDMIFGLKVPYDAYENYRGILRPGDFVLYSSGPNKGITRALKKSR